MNIQLTVGQQCRVYQYNPEAEVADIYIEGDVTDIDFNKGIYSVLCTKDATVSDSKIQKEPELKALSRKGKIILVPIEPDSGDFLGRISLI